MSHHTVSNDHRTHTPDLARITRRLRDQLDRGERQIVELELTLTDPDSIQEDRDGARLVIDSIRDDLHEIRRALDRVEQGRYGRCVTCGEPIAPERLETIPFAATCNRCA